MEREENTHTHKRNRWWWDILLVLIFIAAGYFRFIGLDWDQDHHLHPDERFLTMVETSISPVDSLDAYFNTDQSSLNPNNRGHGFYVYGTLPLFTVRYIAEWVNQTGYSEVYLVGRFVSASADLLSIFLVYLAAGALYRKKAISLLAAAFSAFSVLQIQLSHYFTVDIFANLFSTLTFYFAVRILRGTQAGDYEKIFPADQTTDLEILRAVLTKWSTILPYLLFGAAFGMSVASKINAVPLALLLPVAVLINYIRFTPEERKRALVFFIRDVAAAGFVSILVFRIFQPYAFSGPGFFGILPNENWVDSLRQLSGLSGGDVDFPPALQWARRPVWFGLQNMVLWGMGLPLGVLAWAGFVYMGYRILRGEWYSHALIWGWTAVYFSWQSLNFTSSMRYFLLIYPMLQIIAAWLLVYLWEHGRIKTGRFNAARLLAVVMGGLVVLATLAYAFAFSRIYARPVTRLAASGWIYQNVQAAVNLQIDTGDEVVNQPVPFPLAAEVRHQEPLILAFEPQYDGAISEIEFSYLLKKNSETPLINFTAWISDQRENPRALTSSTIASDFPASSNDPRGNAYQMGFLSFLNVKAGDTYYLFIETLDPGSSVQLAGPLTLTYLQGEKTLQQSLPPPVELLDTENDYMVTINPVTDGLLTGVFFPHIVNWPGTGSNQVLEVSIIDTASERSVVANATLSGSFAPGEDPRGEGYSFQFDTPVAVSSAEHITLQLKLVEGDGELAIYGSKQALETTWDDPLPYSLQGFSVFDYYNGLYRTDLNFEMYWDDNQEKRERFYWILEQADYLFISSNRQWGTTIRVPERYPLTTAYYRSLIGCPPEKEIYWCYATAEPGMFSSDLGFELVETFQSDPNLGSIRFNTQFAEEAFTVYDHPKVLIFRKTEDYSAEKVREILGAVDLSRVIHLTPKEASDYKGNLVLPAERQAEQRQSGTWSALFDRDDLINRYPVLGLLAWYAMISLMGICVYPLTRMVFRGLNDRGYPLAKLLGLILLVFIVWLLGSMGVPFTRLTITVSFLFLVVVNLLIYLRNPNDLKTEFRLRWKYYLLVEGLFLGVFLFDLFIRLGNPDLWHPYKGGEKPMDFSYLNAVLKSVQFPPYDPWFAGGYINYYYYGFVLVGVPVKWLGIVPAVAYNFILPSLMAYLAAGVFCLGGNLVSPRETAATTGLFCSLRRRWLPVGLKGLLGGFSAMTFMVFLGNLATVRMIWHGIMRLVATGSIEEANIFEKISWTVQGLGSYLSGKTLPYGAGDWYWIPSRVYPHEPITEFPFFTFLYADLHAHLIALPITVLVLCFVISFIKHPRTTEEQSPTGALLGLALTASFGALIIGALRPTNTWDLPTYLVLGVLAVVYTLLRMQPRLPGFGIKNKFVVHFLYAFAFAGGLVVLTFLLYQPFGRWYGQGYNSVQFWKGDHSPFWSYLTHWGLFLFLIISWLTWETRNWMAETPVSALTRLRPYKGLLQVIFVLLIAAVIALLILGIGIGWFVLPLAFWAAVLILRPGMPDMKRVVLFMIGSALVLTLAVELIVLEGDIGRMNTVFKFYLQAWTLFSVSAGASLVWLAPAILNRWQPAVRTFWQIVLAVLVGSAALFPLFGGIDKIRDRMNKQAPHTLDGMAYMAYGEYSESGVTMDLEQDYQAILWMQENIEGTPVIVEANTPEYRWGSRYTIYTGLPGVVGWNWHQRQQRAIVTSDWVTDRVAEVDHFYRTLDRESVEEFLRRYDIVYVVVGQLERAYYAGEGLAKFEQWESDLWREVYRVEETVIYEVIEQE